MSFQIPCMRAELNRTLDQLLSDYLTKGFTYLEIQEFLRVYNQQTISLSTLGRHLKKLNLFRRPVKRNRTDDITLLAAVGEELSGSGSNIGYRRVWAHLRKTGFRRDVCWAILQDSPDGVSRRKRRKLRRRKCFSAGPNYSWHIDGYDKLKPFGFSLHGCIDGFSSRLMWLEVSSTNKKPEIIGKFYLDAVKQLQSIPKKSKAEDGNEKAIS